MTHRDYRVHSYATKMFIHILKSCIHPKYKMTLLYKMIVLHNL